MVKVFCQHGRNVLCLSAGSELRPIDLTPTGPYTLLVIENGGDNTESYRIALRETVALFTYCHIYLYFRPKLPPLLSRNYVL